MFKKLALTLLTLALLCSTAFASENLKIFNGIWRVDPDATLALGNQSLEAGVELEFVKVNLEAIVLEILTNKMKYYTTMGGRLNSGIFSVLSEDGNTMLIKMGDKTDINVAFQDDNTFTLSDSTGPESRLIFKRVIRPTSGQ